MAITSPTTLPTVMTTADGTPLKVSLQRALRRNKFKAFLLVAPLLAFILITFVLPIGDMLLRSVQNPQVVEIMPNTVQALARWDGQEVPPEEVFAALVTDLKKGQQTRDIGKVGNRLNYERPGMISLIRKSANRAEKIEQGPYKEAMLAVDKLWGDLTVWRLIKREGRPYTDSYLLAAVDLTRDADGNIVPLPENERIHLKLFGRTFFLSLLITGLTILLGYPIAYLLATLPARKSNLLMILVLLPFWTSLLVRTTSWIVMLQNQGVLNSLLVALGIISDDNRLSLIFNQTGTIIAMTHILLPFMILPLYSVMKGIPVNYVRAARSLGANPWLAFWKVYVPQTLPGIGAGGVLVFILAIGYFITPALVGGASGQLISNRIAFHMQESLNWGLAAAIGTILLIAVLLLYLLYNRLVGVDNMKLG
ncbi:MAG TPA: ABC transporter permease [Candidatus Competibacteraceae bacterium]|nr:ABC transporter permease [Candidatus Competibacteraceae bacterium]